MSKKTKLKLPTSLENRSVEWRRGYLMSLSLNQIAGYNCAVKRFTVKPENKENDKNE